MSSQQVIIEQACIRPYVGQRWGNWDGVTSTTEIEPLPLVALTLTETIKTTLGAGEPYETISWQCISLNRKAQRLKT